MRMRIKQKMGLFLAVSTMATWLVMATAAQAGPPPLSTNPGNLAIFPAKGQSPEQQRLDESAAYDWATQQTGWDPYQAKALLDQQGHAAADAAGAARGGAVKGAAGGALVGVAVGAIAGDAGEDGRGLRRCGGIGLPAAVRGLEQKLHGRHGGEGLHGAVKQQH